MVLRFRKRRERKKKDDAEALRAQREIPARIAGGAAASAAADGTWILRARGHGPARAAGKTVDRAIRPWTGVHVQRTDSGVRAVQFPVCGAAAGRFL